MLNPERYEYHDIDDVSYGNAMGLSDEILSAICFYTHLNANQISYHDVIRYFVEFQRVRFIFFEENTIFDSPINARKLGTPVTEFKMVDPVFSNCVCGFTVPTEQTSIVFLNGSLYYPRLVFTALHELSHVFRFRSNPTYLKAFAKLNPDDPSSKYPKDLLPFEDSANVMASNFLLNSDALTFDIRNQATFIDLEKKYAISEKALHNRIHDYLTHTLHMNEPYALSAVLDYRNHGTDGAVRLSSVIAEAQLLN